ncbi:MAG: hypothetical protein H3C39_02585 [Flavobacteriia bacterium]|nr:hypothetical protein [Flavobacteriia bacterium]
MPKSSLFFLFLMMLIPVGAQSTLIIETVSHESILYDDENQEINILSSDENQIFFGIDEAKTIFTMNSLDGGLQLKYKISESDFKEGQKSGSFFMTDTAGKEFFVSLDAENMTMVIAKVSNERKTAMDKYVIGKIYFTGN